MPYSIRKKLGLTLVTMPQLTQALGPWMRKSNAKYAKKLGQEKDLLTALADQLPNYSHFRQNWNHAYTNWLPFYWRGFLQTTYYTYRLPDLSNMDLVWKDFRENIRTDVRKAESRFNLKVRDDLGIDAFLDLNAQIFQRQGMAAPYSKDFVRRLDAACETQKSRKIFIAEDGEGKRHAAAYIVWDSQSAYYLIGGSDPALRSSGATSLCLWEAIRFASTVTQSFDFEGSMLEPVERSFRAFGAIQTPYFSISHTPSRLMRLRNSLR